MRSLIIGILCILAGALKLSAQTASPLQVNFGTLVVGDSRSATVTVKNTSIATIHVLSYGTSSSLEFSAAGSDAFLLPDSSTRCTVTFSPATVILPNHLHTGTLTIGIEGLPPLYVPLQGYDHSQDTATVSIARN